MSRDPRRASFPEILGAWLRVWTPPRDVEVPPVPVRGLAIGAVVVLLAAAGAYALIAPRIDESKARSAAAERAEREARRAVERRRMIAEQRPRTAVAADLRPGAGATPAERVAARTALLDLAETWISDDARRRARAGELHGRPGATECDPHPPREEGERPEQGLSDRLGVYDCLVLLREIPATETNQAGRLGYPFRAVLDFRAFRVTWCKTNPIPSEQVIPDPRDQIAFPRACRRPPARQSHRQESGKAGRMASSDGIPRA